MLDRAIKQQTTGSRDHVGQCGPMPCRGARRFEKWCASMRKQGWRAEGGAVGRVLRWPPAASQAKEHVAKADKACGKAKEITNHL